MGLVGYYLREARKRPASFLARRARDAVRRAGRAAFASLGGHPYRARLSRGGHFSLGSLLDPQAIDEALGLVERRNPEELARLYERADAAVRGEFPIYSRVATTGPEIDWHHDYHSGRSWPIRFHTRYRYIDLIDLGRPSDIKVPWELSRLQVLPVLAIAYRLTREDVYRARLLDLVEQWQRSNPTGFGVNWTVGMEVALRAISLVLTAELLNGTPAAESFATSNLLRLLAEHGRFIYRNLEYSDVNGNHYTSCLLGLLYLGVYLSAEREAPAWRRLALAELRKEVLAQTYRDGVCHEGSIPYHRLVLEILVHAAILCRADGLDLGAEPLRRLESMVEFVAAYTKPSGEAPVWGDADDGRIHDLGAQPINDHRYLLTIGAALFGRTDLLADAGPLRLDAALLLAGGLLERTAEAQPGVPPPTSTAFPQGGFFLLRRAGDYALIDCGDVGYRGRGGHGHNDALSVEIALQGVDVVTDSGCSSYTRSVDERAAMLSARAHNVAVVDGHEPAPISRAEGVRLPHATRCPVEVVAWEPREGRFTGRHLGYRALPDPVVYERRVELAPDRSAFTIQDRLTGFGTRTIVWYFHLAESWIDVALEADGATLTGDGSEARVRIRCREPRVDLSLERSRRYPSYDCRRERFCLTMKVRQELPIQAEIEIACIAR